MADKKREQSSFTVTDRRLFTPEGELRSDASEETIASRPEPTAPAAAPRSTRERNSLSTGGSR